MDEETAEALTRTKALYDAGVLTDEEWLAKKNELLRAQPPADEDGGVVEGHVVAVQPQRVHPEPRPPPPLAPEDLYTGPRGDGLRSTDEISGEYSAACACVHGLPVSCNSMTVVPLGADAIETRRTGCVFFPPFIGPAVTGDVRTRDPGTNAFGDMTFSAEGTATQRDGVYKKRRTSQTRAFQKVDARDLAGRWCGCACSPVVPFWPFSGFFCTTRKALNEDQYEESGRCCFLLTLCLPLIPVSATRTRKYVNGLPTNGFAKDHGSDILWYRDPGCAGGLDENGVPFFARKLG